MEAVHVVSGFPETDREQRHERIRVFGKIHLHEHLYAFPVEGADHPADFRSRIRPGRISGARSKVKIVFRISPVIPERLRHGHRGRRKSLFPGRKRLPSFRLCLLQYGSLLRHSEGCGQLRLCRSGSGGFFGTPLYISCLYRRFSRISGPGRLFFGSCGRPSPCSSRMPVFIRSSHGRAAQFRKRLNLQRIVKFIQRHDLNRIEAQLFDVRDLLRDAGKCTLRPHLRRFSGKSLHMQLIDHQVAQAVSRRMILPAVPAFGSDPAHSLFYFGRIGIKHFLSGNLIVIADVRRTFHMDRAHISRPFFRRKRYAHLPVHVFSMADDHKGSFLSIRYRKCKVDPVSHCSGSETLRISLLRQIYVFRLFSHFQSSAIETRPGRLPNYHFSNLHDSFIIHKNHSKLHRF